MLAASIAKLMTFKRAWRKYVAQNSALTMSARSTYSELVRDPKLESLFTTPSSFRFSSFLQVTNPPPLHVNLWTRLMAKALEPFLRELSVKGWFLDSTVGSGHFFCIDASIATSTCCPQTSASLRVKRWRAAFCSHQDCSARKRNIEMRQSTTGTLSAQGFGSFFWNLQDQNEKPTRLTHAGCMLILADDYTQFLIVTALWFSEIVI